MVMTGTLNESTPTLSLSSVKGRRYYVGINLKNLVNGDDLTITLERQDGAGYVVYDIYNVVKTAGVIIINDVPQSLEEINIENIYVNDSHGVRFTLSFNSETWRDLPYWYDKMI